LGGQGTGAAGDGVKGGAGVEGESESMQRLDEPRAGVGSGSSPPSSRTASSSCVSEDNSSPDSDSSSSCSSRSGSHMGSELGLRTALLLESDAWPGSYPVELCTEEEEEEEQQELGGTGGDCGQACADVSGVNSCGGAGSSSSKSTAWTVSDLLSLSANAIRPVCYKDFEAAVQQVSSTEFDLSDKYTEWSQRFGSGGGLKRDAGWKSLPMYM
jgi:hypothetical protein